jgi:hypothetical protein
MTRVRKLAIGATLLTLTASMLYVLAYQQGQHTSCGIPWVWPRILDYWSAGAPPWIVILLIQLLVLGRAGTRFYRMADAATAVITTLYGVSYLILCWYDIAHASCIPDESLLFMLLTNLGSRGLAIGVAAIAVLDILYRLGVRIRKDKGEQP